MLLAFALLVSAAAAQAPASAPPPAPLPEVAVERRLADSLGLAVGDTVRLGTAPDSLRTRAVVAALFDPAADPSSIMRREYQVRLHLPDLGALLGAPDRVDRVSVVLNPGADPAAVAARLNRVAFGFRAYESRALASESSRTFLVVNRFHRAIAIITVVASAVFLLCIMLLKVEERRLDAAVMRFVGVRRRTIVGALVLEAALVAAVGSVLGIAIAWGASALTNLYYQRLFDTRLVFSLLTPGVVGFSVALSLVLGIGAGALAALRLVRVPPMVLWRRG
ncbi:MAG TPA: FtsX-like permease family protein [Gemmatimonadales bacterium]|nr:FtsX-like permease family protein [Gemmatimonadales bacterium]